MDPNYDDDDGASTPRDTVEQRVIRSRYKGPKNHRGQPDTTGTDEIGVMNYLPDDDIYKSYSGEWKNGEFNGKGTVVFKNDDTYTGGFQDGSLHGHGVYKHSNGMVRDGEWVNDVQVRGTLIRPDYKFQGTFDKNHHPHTGEFTYNDGSIFRGTKESEIKKVGTFTYPDGDIFYGTFEYQDGWKLHGDNAAMFVRSRPNAQYNYEGQMRNGRKHGFGIMKIMSGPLMGQHYSARFNMDSEVRNSRTDLKKTPKQGGARHKRTQRRRKNMR